MNDNTIAISINMSVIPVLRFNEFRIESLLEKFRNVFETFFHSFAAVFNGAR